jgi:hypothetical protein
MIGIELPAYLLCINHNQSNSTFSWWAAYLNENPNKQIYCPKYFLGHVIEKKYPIHIYPSDWHQIKVD